MPNIVAKSKLRPAIIQEKKPKDLRRQQSPGR